MAAELKLKFEVADNFKKKIQDSFKGVFNMSGKGGKAPEPNFKYIGKPMVELNNKIKTFAKSMSLNNSSLNKLNSQISNLQKIQSKITPGMPGSTGRMSKLNELIERNQGKILKLTDKNNKINLKQSAAIDAMLAIDGKNPIGEQTINTLSQQIKVLEDIRDNLSDIEEINKLNTTIGEKQEKLGELTGVGTKGKGAKGGIGIGGAMAMGGVVAVMMKLIESTKAIQFVLEVIGGLINALVAPFIPILLTLLKPFLVLFLFVGQLLFKYLNSALKSSGLTDKSSGELMGIGAGATLVGIAAMLITGAPVSAAVALALLMTPFISGAIDVGKWLEDNVLKFADSEGINWGNIMGGWMITESWNLTEFIINKVIGFIIGEQFDLSEWAWKKIAEWVTGTPIDMTMITEGEMSEIKDMFNIKLYNAFAKVVNLAIDSMALLPKIFFMIPQALTSIVNSIIKSLNNYLPKSEQINKLKTPYQVIDMMTDKLKIQEKEMPNITSYSPVVNPITGNDMNMSMLPKSSQSIQTTNNKFDIKIEVKGDMSKQNIDPIIKELRRKLGIAGAFG